MIQNSIKIINLTKGYGAEPIFQNVNAFIPERSFVFLTGKSGSGKSTLLKIIYRLESANQGQVVIGPYNNTTSLTEFRQNIGFIFQDYKLLENQTARENIQLPLTIRGMSRGKTKSKILNIARECDVVHLLDQKVKHLSGGEKQLIALVRATIILPILILADEPTANLDNEAGEKVLYLLEKMNKQGATVVLATHDLSLIQAKKARIFLIQEKQIKKVQDT